MPPKPVTRPEGLPVKKSGRPSKNITPTPNIQHDGRSEDRSSPAAGKPNAQQLVAPSRKSERLRKAPNLKRKHPEDDIENASDLPPATSTPLGDGSGADCMCPCKHHPISKKYPNGLDAPHVANLDKFIRDFSKSLHGTFPKIPKDYDSAHALFISWEEDDLNTKVEIDELRSLLGKLRFTANKEDFTTSHYIIPSDHSQHRLQEALVNARNNYALEESKLLIVYYGGHGKLDKQDRSIWYAWKQPPEGTFSESPSLNWTILQSDMVQCDGNVLFIHDCCCATGMVDRRQWKGVKELLAASGKYGLTSSVNANSFTSAIIQEVKQIHGSDCHISTLHARLCHNQSSHNLRLTPIRIELSEKAFTESIPIRYPAKGTESGVSDGFSAQARVEDDSMDIIRASLGSSCRILISIRLENPSKPPVVSDWINWFKMHAPPGIADIDPSWNYVQPEAVFHSRSTLLMVSMPIAVWNILPHDPAYTFIDIIESENLMNIRRLDDPPGEVVASELESNVRIEPVGTQETLEKSISHQSPRRKQKLRSPRHDDYPRRMIIEGRDDGVAPSEAPSYVGLHIKDKQPPQLRGLASESPEFVALDPEDVEFSANPKADRRSPPTPVVPQKRYTASELRNKLVSAINKIRIKKGSYTYQNLTSKDGIRVLRVLKGQPGSNLHCTLIPTALPLLGNNLSKSMPYEALSYWWGNGEATKKIWISSYYDATIAVGRTPSKLIAPDTFYVRPNLYEALQQLRSEDNDIDIWVDALCINQSNPDERAAQVSRMHDIYSRATNVCIWLGAGTPETRETFKFLKEILDLRFLDYLVDPKTDPSKNYLERRLLIEKLMRGKWFSRRWVIQELAFARKATIRWGAEEMQWVDFSDAITLFMTKHDEIHQILSNKPEYMNIGENFRDLRVPGANELINATSNLFRKSDDGKIQQRLINLEMLVSYNLLAFEVSEERDTIYAVLSIAQDASVNPVEMGPRTSWSISPEKKLSALENPSDTKQITHPPQPDERRIPFDPRIHPDYEKRLNDVYTDFMDFCIEKSQSLDIICRHWAPTRKKLTAVEKLKLGKEGEEKLPSWIPSIQGHAFGSQEQALKVRINGDSLVGGQERKNRQNYNASQGLLPWIKFGRYDSSKESKEPRDNIFQGGPLIKQDLAGQHFEGHGASKDPQQKSKKLRKFDGTLFVKGYRIGEIDKVSSVWQGLIKQEALDMGGWPLNCEDSEVPEKLWQTLVADRGPNGTNPPSWYHRACRECLAHVDSAGDLNTTLLKDAEGTPSTMVAFLERVQQIIWNRTFFLTKADAAKGRESFFGLASPKALKGDIICIFYGCSVPISIRPSGDGFAFIGECYVHRMMDGEAIPTPAKQPIYPYEGAETFKLI